MRRRMWPKRFEMLTTTANWGPYSGRCEYLLIGCRVTLTRERASGAMDGTWTKWFLSRRKGQELARLWGTTLPPVGWRRPPPKPTEMLYLTPPSGCLDCACRRRPPFPRGTAAILEAINRERGGAPPARAEGYA